MATWIAHLRVAEGLLPLYDGIDEEQFSIGHVAPDSGIPDSDWKMFDPPREITHYRRTEAPGEHGFEDMAFYRQHLATLGVATCDSPQHAFLLGYWMHLITDNLWRQVIWRPARDRYAHTFPTLHGLIVALKKDWYGLDRLYVETHPESLFWRVFLDAQYTESFIASIPAEAIQVGLQNKKAYYLDQEALRAAHEHEYTYLVATDIDAFCQLAIERIASIIETLARPGIAIDGTFSALDLHTPIPTHPKATRS